MSLTGRDMEQWPANLGLVEDAALLVVKSNSNAGSCLADRAIMARTCTCWP